LAAVQRVFVMREDAVSRPPDTFCKFSLNRFPVRHSHLFFRDTSKTNGAMDSFRCEEKKEDTLADRLQKSKNRCFQVAEAVKAFEALASRSSRNPNETRDAFRRISLICAIRAWHRSKAPHIVVASLSTIGGRNAAIGLLRRDQLGRGNCWNAHNRIVASWLGGIPTFVTAPVKGFAVDVGRGSQSQDIRNA
jgi:hypothetical protein